MEEQETKEESEEEPENPKAFLPEEPKTSGVEKEMSSDLKGIDKEMQEAIEIPED